MDGNARFAANHKKPLVTDNELVELLWHNGSVIAHARTHQRPPSSDPSTSGLTGEVTAPWFPDRMGDDDGGVLEKDLYSQLWQNVANAAMERDMFAGSSSQPPSFAQLAGPPVKSGIGSSWTGDMGSAFCGSNQVPEMPVEDREENVAVPSEGLRGRSTHDGGGTSSSGGSGSNFGGAGMPSENTLVHKRKGRGIDDSDSRSEDAVEETKSLRRYTSKRRSRAAEVHNLSERRRRDRINEKMRALQELIPHCNKTDKASILDEAIEYLKSLQMQVQIMWMTTGMTPMMFPGTHQFMSPMAVGTLPAVQGLSQMPRMPYMSHPLPNQMPRNSFPAMNALNVANQMQNIRLRESSNRFLHHDSMQTATPQVPGPYAYGPQVTQQNQIPKVPAGTIVPTSADGPPSLSDGI